MLKRGDGQTKRHRECLALCYCVNGLFLLLTRIGCVCVLGTYLRLSHTHLKVRFLLFGQQPSSHRIFWAPESIPFSPFDLQIQRLVPRSAQQPNAPRCTFGRYSTFFPGMVVFPPRPRLQCPSSGREGYLVYIPFCIIIIIIHMQQEPSHFASLIFAVYEVSLMRSLLLLSQGKSDVRPTKTQLFFFGRLPFSMIAVIGSCHFRRPRPPIFKNNYYIENKITRKSQEGVNKKLIYSRSKHVSFDEFQTPVFRVLNNSWQRFLIYPEIDK